MAKVFTIGEALIDFIPDTKGVQLKDVGSFARAAGGAPANVACAVAKLGGDSAFIGMVGEDAFGDHLVETLEGAHVDVAHVFRTGEAGTALAFVSLKEDGNRDFSFYRNPSADMLLSEAHIGDNWFAAGDVLHFCSVDLIEAPVKYAHKRAISLMKQQGGIISFDPNVRLPLWPSKEACRAAILEFLPFSDILKISDEELAFITGINDEAEAIQSLFEGDVKHIIYTRGAEGATWFSRSGDSVTVPGFKVEVADTTGAGDSFIGGLLYRLQQEGAGLSVLDRNTAAEWLAFANATGAATATKAGAIDALPALGEVLALMGEQKK
ncbi:carbohydrate kinase family protein [Paenibacillus sp. CAU 1782]